MQERRESVVDILKIRKAIEAGVPLLITTYTLPHDMEVYMCSVLAAFLKELNHEYMTEYLSYCLSELTTNAKKANTKRIYFKEQNLDINNEADYKKGMETFKQDTMGNINKYLTMQKNAGLYVKFLLQVRNGKIKIEIRNNSELTIFEYKRIHDKITRAQQFSSVEDAFSQIIDETEGAGLGLVIMILMLRKIGLDDDNFCYISENGETITRIVLPLNSNSQAKFKQISKSIATIIDSLPPFPENIFSIHTLLDDAETKLSVIAEKISNDVALTADILKLANSAAFSQRNPCQSISKAVQMIGTKGIKNLLYSIGAIRCLGGKSEEIRKLWDHSYRVAFYAYNLACNYFPNEREMIEDSYVCGLLHDMGKVLFENQHPQITKKIEEICNEQDQSAEALEKLYAGANHSEIGASIAEKWNFPKVFIETIRYHHKPEVAPAPYKNLATLVYFSNMIENYQNNKIIDFYQFDEKILDYFKIKNESHLEQLSNHLKNAFEIHK